MPTIWATTTLLNKLDPVEANSIAARAIEECCDQIARNQDACNEWQVCFSPEGQVFIRMEVSSIKRVKLPPGWETGHSLPAW